MQPSFKDLPIPAPQPTETEVRISVSSDLPLIIQQDKQGIWRVMNIVQAGLFLTDSQVSDLRKQRIFLGSFYTLAESFNVGQMGKREIRKAVRDLQTIDPSPNQEFSTNALSIVSEEYPEFLTALSDTQANALGRIDLDDCDTARIGSYFRGLAYKLSVNGKLLRESRKIRQNETLRMLRNEIIDELCELLEHVSCRCEDPQDLTHEDAVRHLASWKKGEPLTISPYILDALEDLITAGNTEAEIFMEIINRKELGYTNSLDRTGLRPGYEREEPEDVVGYYKQRSTQNPYEEENW